MAIVRVSDRIEVSVVMMPAFRLPNAGKIYMSEHEILLTAIGWPMVFGILWLLTRRQKRSNSDD